AVGVAAVVMALVTGLAFLASGSLGGGRLAAVGPTPLVMGACAAGLVVLGFLAEAGFQGLRLSWDLHRAEQRSAQARVAPGDDDPVGAASDRRGDPAAADEPGSEVPPAGTVQPAPRGRPAPATQESIAIPVLIGQPSAGDAAGGTAQREPADQIDTDPTHVDVEARDVLDADRADCTVDLTVADQDLTRIRAAARSTRAGNGQGPRSESD
ncbi:MAG: hypothetical protein OEU98_07720, partial [Actinomycetota bacterium]|nr:hypothetical protein [Actinomycetota bacterium]